jgi:hypothetical protein
MPLITSTRPSGLIALALLHWGQQRAVVALGSDLNVAAPSPPRVLVDSGTASMSSRTFAQLRFVNKPIRQQHRLWIDERDGPRPLIRPFMLAGTARTPGQGLIFCPTGNSSRGRRPGWRHRHRALQGSSPSQSR